MLARFRKFLKAPTFDTPEKSIQAQNINTILLFTFALTFAFFLYALFFPPIGQVIIAIVAIVLAITGGLVHALGFLLWVGIVLLVLAVIAFLIRSISGRRV